MKDLVAAVSGIVFGMGLAISQMTNPNKVLSFLDFWSDGWDPSLAIVMLAALAVSSLAYAIARRLEKPLFANGFDLPTAVGIDRRLLAGATLFGIGWGLAGFCPGPAIAALITGERSVLTFVVAMLVGAAIFRHAPTLRSGSDRAIDRVRIR